MAIVVLALLLLNIEYECFLNIKYELKDWNKLMHMTNGNFKNSLVAGHWNGGPSYLGRSQKGQEKLND